MKDKEILKEKVIYEAAKLKNPNRWSGQTRNWTNIEKVYLNYLQEDKDVDIKLVS